MSEPIPQGSYSETLTRAIVEESKKPQYADMDKATASLKIVRYLRDHRREVFQKGHRGDELALFLAEEV